jgi:calcineurin-like phosphoesterase
MKFIISTIIVILSITAIIGIVFFVYQFFISKEITSTIDNPKAKHTQAIQLEILNSTEQPGLASKMMDYLRKRGFDVVRVGNYHKSLEHISLVIERNPTIKTAHFVANALGIKDSCILFRPDSSLFLNCTVIIGNDFKTLTPFK